MSVLDNMERIKTLDVTNMLGSVEALPDQIRQTVEDGESFEINLVSEVKNVIVAGMGGSALGADVIKNLYADALPCSFEIVKDYNLPAYADRSTLLIVVSYSGNTEETVSAAKQGLDKGCQIAFMTAGGELEKMATENNAPLFKIVAKNNPCNQPRMALGYMITALAIMLTKAGLLSLTAGDYESAILACMEVDKRCGVGIKTEENPAKMLALEIVDRRPVLMAAEFLEGPLHASTNQLNENAKTFASYNIIPELNHHLMEGLIFPKSLSSTTFFLLFQSKLYHARNQERTELVAKLFENKKFDHTVVELTTDSRLTQVFELLTMMSYTSIYLAILEEIDPSPVPIVDWFKNELA
ncbi:MAG: bifunctional phosphoglucose/phosphomannose isomerase [Pseudomonadales bacterium]|jgi:glucose/mannose-6-phosphate isomerase|nr:bifunctional phosphoglucose/phosphomannose isomerase [Pseudomonadales bacterium]